MEFENRTNLVHEIFATLIKFHEFGLAIFHETFFAISSGRLHLIFASIPVYVTLKR